VGTPIAYVVTHGQEGLLAPVEDWKELARHLKTLLEDEQLRTRLRSNARRLAENYSIEKSQQRFEQALLELRSV
jgi:glycosyltransferase involved in cell wall biosynthesis